MAWIYLLIAGTLEVVWAAGLKSLSNNFAVSLLIVTVSIMAASLGALYWSMRTLPLGVAYPVWTGIGSVGSVLVSVILYKQDVSLATIIGVACLLVGMFLVCLDAH